MTCSRQRCKRPARFGSLCRSHARKKADEKFRVYIKERDGRCMMAEVPIKGGCKGALQCCHIVTRGRHITQFNPSNAIAGCQAHHFYFTLRPDEWRRWVNDHQPGLYEQMDRLADAGTKAEADLLMERWL